jgi:hypothetical protein
VRGGQIGQRQARSLAFRVRQLRSQGAAANALFDRPVIAAPRIFLASLINKPASVINRQYLQIECGRVKK